MANEAPHDSDALASLYNLRRPLLERAGRQLMETLEDLIHDVAPVEGLRPRLVEFRVKDLESLSLKAFLNSWGPAAAFDNARDLVGCRVVCNNKSDVRKILSHLGRLTGPIRLVDGEIRDNLDLPTISGYRGVNALVEIDVMQGTTRTRVRGEIQLRTVLQDSWAVLAHQDIYKRGNAPELLRRLFVLISDQLDTVQKTVDLIRIEIEHALQLHAELLLPLMIRIEHATTIADLDTCDSILNLVAPYLDSNWMAYLQIRTGQKRPSPGSEREKSIHLLQNIWGDTRNDLELRMRALIARCEFPHKGYGGPIPELIKSLRDLIPRFQVTTDSNALDIASEAWFWTGELERHRKNWTSAREAYEAAGTRTSFKARALHRKALIARMLGDEDSSYSLLKEAGDVEPLDDMLKGTIERDLAIHCLRLYQRTLAEGFLKDANEHLDKSISFLKSTIDQAGYAISIAKRGRACLFRRQFPQASEYLNKAVSMLQSLDNRLFEAQALTDCCRLKKLQHVGDMEKEISRLRELSALDKSDQLEFQSSKYLGQALWYWGQVMLEASKFQEAILAFAEDMSLNLQSGESWQKVVNGISASLRAFNGDRNTILNAFQLSRTSFPDISSHHIQEILLSAGYDT